MQHIYVFSILTVLLINTFYNLQREIHISRSVWLENANKWSQHGAVSLEVFHKTQELWGRCTFLICPQLAAFFLFFVCVYTQIIISPLDQTVGENSQRKSK